MKTWIALMAFATLFPATVGAIELAPMRNVKRILFLGDSITYAGGYVDDVEAWLLLHAREHRYEIVNAGLPSENLSGLTEPNHAGGAFPRPDLHERLNRVLDRIKPDLVVACYGMNDGIYYPFSEERFRKYADGVEWLRSKVVKTGAKCWLLTPPPFDPNPIEPNTLPAGLDAYPSPYVGYDSVLARYSEWLVSRRRNGWSVTDIHTPLNAYLTEQRRANPNFAFAGDGVHLNDAGHRLLARELLRSWGAPKAMLPTAEGSALPQAVLFHNLVHERRCILTDAWLTDTKHTRPGMPVGLPISEAEAKAGEIETRIRAMLPPANTPSTAFLSDYHGYPRYDFTVDGCNALIVAPNRSRKGNPWIWRAEFFDHRPELDLALLNRGCHLVYIEVGNTFGAPSAMKHWDAFYKELTRHWQLAPKPVLEGLSRGGLYAYNWAAAHPNQVSVLYGDNPVCDFKSWPGGKGKGPGSPDDWKKLIHDYGFASEAEAMAWKRNPVDNLAPLAKAHVPIIHCAADADEVVPYEENTVVVKERYETLGGEIKVIVKHGFHHHPHGLDDPTPLVEFIEAHEKR